MSKKICMYKRGGMLFAADDDGKSVLKKVPNESFFMADVSMPRNIQNHRRFFAFLNTVFDMQDHFPNTEHLRRWMIMKAGYYYTITAPNGNVIFQPESIAFEKMEEPEFKQLFSNCIDVVCAEFDLDRDQLYRVVEFS